MAATLDNAQMETLLSSGELDAQFASIGINAKQVSVMQPDLELPDGIYVVGWLVSDAGGKIRFDFTCLNFIVHPIYPPRTEILVASDFSSNRMKPALWYLTRQYGFTRGYTIVPKYTEVNAARSVEDLGGFLSAYGTSDLQVWTIEGVGVQKFSITKRGTNLQWTHPTSGDRVPVKPAEAGSISQALFILQAPVSIVPTTGQDVLA